MTTRTATKPMPPRTPLLDRSRTSPLAANHAPTTTRPQMTKASRNGLPCGVSKPCHNIMVGPQKMLTTATARTAD